MILYESHDIVFFLQSLKFPSPAFDIMTFVAFSSNQARSAGYSLTHTHSRNNMHRHFYFTRLSRLWNSAFKSQSLQSMCLRLSQNLSIFYDPVISGFDHMHLSLLLSLQYLYYESSCLVLLLFIYWWPVLSQVCPQYASITQILSFFNSTCIIIYCKVH